MNDFKAAPKKTGTDCSSVGVMTTAAIVIVAKAIVAGVRFLQHAFHCPQIPYQKRFHSSRPSATTQSVPCAPSALSSVPLD
ncbi:hypothetical protein ACET3X_003495 [Alternaria dauci]|uniref:Uncharacterized protein n=1 Tax=Alternaria dauci TaxID=48095 RepID=A0ABR3USK6_9PLEO